MDTRFEIRPGRTINIHIHKHLKSDETAFLIHGLGGRSDQWREQVNALKDKYTLIIPDLLGHGKSDKPQPGKTNPYRFSELELDLQALFEKFSTRSNIVMGHSYGGALAVALTINHQDKINKLVLISPTPCVPKLQIPAFYHLPVFVMKLIRPWMEKKFQQLAFDPTADKTLLRDEARAGKSNPMYVIKAIVNGMQDIPAIDITMLTVPTLIIIGANDGIIPPAIQQKFYKSLPQQEFKIIQQAAHMVMLEKPVDVDNTITSFLRSEQLVKN